MKQCHLFVLGHPCVRRPGHRGKCVGAHEREAEKLRFVARYAINFIRGQLERTTTHADLRAHAKYFESIVKRAELARRQALKGRR